MCWSTIAEHEACLEEVDTSMSLCWRKLLNLIFYSLDS